MVETPLVNFIIAGAQKGGTTALFDYLAHQTGVSLSDVKEVHYFDDDMMDWTRPDYSAYHARFRPEATGVTGEATPSYIYWPGCLDRIRAYNPAMKLILTLRDPLERAWSHWRMEYARGVETHAFAWCIRQGRQRLFQDAPWGYHREFSYVERGFYGEQIADLLTRFPAEQLLILRSDDLRDDPTKAIASVRTFLGLPPGPPPVPLESHVGVKVEEVPSDADIILLRHLYARDQLRLRELTGICFF